MSVERNRSEVGRTRRAAVLAALGEPVRLGVVDLLQAGDLSPDALARELDVPGNLLAHHLKVLQAAGIVTRAPSQHDRRRTYVHLVPGSFEGLLPAPEQLTAPRVVFLCTHNSARSVLAEAAWHSLSPVPTASAGTRPARRVHPRARTAARRAGLTLLSTVPRAVEDVLRPDDVVVSVCDAVNEELAALTQPHFHWSIPDPAGVDTDEAFTSALADITRRVEGLAPRIRGARPGAGQSRPIPGRPRDVRTSETSGSP